MDSVDRQEGVQAAPSNAVGSDCPSLDKEQWTDRLFVSHAHERMALDIYNPSCVSSTPRPRPKTLEPTSRLAVEKEQKPGYWSQPERATVIIPSAPFPVNFENFALNKLKWYDFNGYPLKWFILKLGLLGNRPHPTTPFDRRGSGPIRRQGMASPPVTTRRGTACCARIWATHASPLLPAHVLGGGNPTGRRPFRAIREIRGRSTPARINGSVSLSVGNAQMTFSLVQC